MKTLIILMTAVILTGNAHAQKLKESKLPAAVTAAFAKTYPAVKDAEWEMEDENYLAGFESNDKDVSVLFDAAGAIIEIETEIANSELPQPARDYIAKNYAGKEVTESFKITDAKDTTLTFEAEIGKTDVIFDISGNFIEAAQE